MFRLALRSLAAKKFRLLATALAIVIGVGFTVGTLILADTVERSTDLVVDDITAGVDAIVRGPQPVDAGDMAPSERAPIDDSTVAVVAAVDGVAAAAAHYEGYAEVIGSSGKVLDLTQSVGLNWIGDEELSSFALTAGRAPTADRDVVLGGLAAREAGVAVGDDVDLITAAGTETFRVVGTAEMDGGTDLGGTAFVFFTDAAASGRLTPAGTASSVLVRAERGVAESTITERIAHSLTGADAAGVDLDGVEVLSGADRRAEQKDQIGGMIDLFRQVLLVFAGVALFVGSFTIANTFTITVAQRTRELALVRAVGASRRQVFGLVLLEAVVLGVIASAAGIGAGIATASGLLVVLRGAGMEIPSGDLVIGSSTLATGLVTGLAVTMLAAVSSARRAAAVAPMAAMREGVDDVGTSSRRRAITGGVLATVAVLAVASGLSTGSSSSVGLGGLAAFTAVLALGPVMISPVMAVIGWPLRRIGGVAGRMAAANAVRNPKRSAASAAALVVGVMLVSGASMFAATAKSTIRGDMEQLVVADRVVRAAGMRSGLPSPVTLAATEVDGAHVVPMRDAYAAVGGSVQYVSGVDLGALDGVLEIDVVDGALPGSPIGDRPNDRDLAAVSRVLADEQGWMVGDVVDVQFGSGATAAVTVAATYEPVTQLADVLLPYDAVVAGTVAALDTRILVSGSDAVLAEVELALQSSPTAIVETVSEYAASQAGALDMVLSIVLGFLGLAVVIAVLGIGTTIALSVRERTREIGVLRSIGMSRRQVRHTVRFEAVSIAVLGAVLGSALGLGITWALLRTLDDEGFATPVLPAGTLVGVAVGAGLAGVLAAAVPARRAARMAVLDAVRTA